MRSLLSTIVLLTCLTSSPAGNMPGLSDHRSSFYNQNVRLHTFEVRPLDGSDILLEQDGAELVTARYAHGALVDQPLVMTRGGTDAFYLADHQGSIRFLLDSAGATLNQYTYDAFGRSLVTTESIQNPYTYTAREQDPETGHLHYRARAYDPNIGRFLAQDPIGFAGGDANLYAYVGNDPANFSDPSGLFTPWDALDIVSFFISLNDFRNCPGIGTGFLVIADFAGAALPLLPAWGTLRHAINAVDGVVDIANSADNLADGARGVSNLAGGVPGARIQPLNRGSTANLSNGTTLPRNLREQLGVEQAISNPELGTQLPLRMTDPRWPGSEGWVKMQQIVASGGQGGPINVHYVLNSTAGAVDDFKIVLPGPR